MKKVLVVLMLAGLLIGGCGGIIANAEYSQLIDKTTALSAETAARAEAGTLTEAEKTDALVKQAGVWQRIKDAKDGVKGE